MSHTVSEREKRLIEALDDLITDRANKSMRESGARGCDAFEAAQEWHRNLMVTVLDGLMTQEEGK